MDYRSVGRSGLAVSAFGLGCNNFGMKIDGAAATAVVSAALDAGVTLFDTADIYGGGASEEMLGRALGPRRHEAVIATKFGIVRRGEAPRGGSRRHLVRACEDSLRRLGTDYIDLYFLHKPDPETPIEETLAALDALVTAGKVRYVGASNMAGWQLIDADHVARALGVERFVATQAELNLLNREAERELLPAARHAGVGAMAYYPLAAGLLTGKYRTDQPPPADSRLVSLPAFSTMLNAERLRRTEALAALAAEHGCGLLDLALSWCVTRPGVSAVLFGATSPAQVRANLVAAARPIPAAALIALDDLA